MKGTRSRLWWAFVEVIDFDECSTVLGIRCRLTNCVVRWLYDVVSSIPIQFFLYCTILHWHDYWSCLELSRCIYIIYNEQ